MDAKEIIKISNENKHKLVKKWDSLVCEFIENTADRGEYECDIEVPKEISEDILQIYKGREYNVVNTEIYSNTNMVKIKLNW